MKPRFETDDGRRVPLANVLLKAATATSGWARAPRMEQRWGRILERWLRLDIDVQGLGAVSDRPYVVVSLHEGFADSLAMLRLPISMTFLVRDELFDWPGLGPYLLRAGHIPVGRRPSAGAMRDLVRRSQATVADGGSLAVFAQGTILGIEAAFQPGAAWLARRLRIPVLPVVITGSHRVWEHPFSDVLRFGQAMSMRVLDPVEVDGPEAFRELERGMKAVAREPGMAPVRRFDPERDGWWDEYPYAIDPDFADLAAAHSARRSR